MVCNANSCSSGARSWNARAPETTLKGQHTIRYHRCLTETKIEILSFQDVQSPGVFDGPLNKGIRLTCCRTSGQVHDLTIFELDLLAGRIGDFQRIKTSHLARQLLVKRGIAVPAIEPRLAVVKLFLWQRRFMEFEMILAF